MSDITIKELQVAYGDVSFVSDQLDNAQSRLDSIQDALSHAAALIEDQRLALEKSESNLGEAVEEIKGLQAKLSAEANKAVGGKTLAETEEELNVARVRRRIEKLLLINDVIKIINNELQLHWSNDAILLAKVVMNRMYDELAPKP